jgi:hypothetical protein
LHDPHLGGPAGLRHLRRKITNLRTGSHEQATHTGVRNHAI